MSKVVNRLIWLIFIVPAVYLAFIYEKLPERVAMHFDLEGNPDRFGSRRELVIMTLILTVVNVLVYLLITNAYRIDPKKYAVENKDRLKRIAFGSSLFLSVVLCLILHSSSVGYINFSVSVILAGVGMLFAFIGNYMPNLKPNYFAGLRLPWTLENETNWRKTHYLAGKLWFAGGIALAVICLLVPSKIAIIVFFTVTAIITVIPCVYSYRMYRKTRLENKI